MPYEKFSWQTKQSYVDLWKDWKQKPNDSLIEIASREALTLTEFRILWFLSTRIKIIKVTQSMINADLSGNVFLNVLLRNEYEALSKP